MIEGAKAFIDVKDAAIAWGFRVKPDQAGSGVQRAKLEVIEEEKTIIQGLNFEIKDSGLLVIVGSVGSGKTTLLHAIMGESKLSTGTCSVQGTVAYVEQEPFIISGSIRDNILFGKPYDDGLFARCLEASCLS